MENSPELSVVLPAYLEEENLKELLPGLRAVLDRAGLTYEIVVVDALAPRDNTAAVCALHGAVYINREHGEFFGDAVRTGIRKASGKFLLFMDADGSHQPGLIPDLLRHRDACDVVVASRYVEGGGTENPKLLIFMSRVLNFVYSLVLNIDCRDVSNSFKLYRAKDLKPLRLYCSNFDIVEEILYKIVKNNPAAKIKEIPFTFGKRKFGETKRNLAAFMLFFLWTLVRLRFGK